MSNVVYYAKKTLPITYTWKCSKCGKVNIESAMLQSKQESYSPGRKVNQGIKATIGVQATEEIMQFLQILSGDRGQSSDYRRMGLHPRCSGCRNKEPWSIMNLSRLNGFLLKAGLYILAMDVLFLLFGLLLWISNGTIETFLIPLAIALCLVALFFAVRFIEKTNSNKENEKLGRLSPSAFPVLVIDGKPVVDFEAKYEANTEKVPDETLLKDTTSQRQNLQGKDLPPLLRRAFLFIEDGEWTKADEYLEKVLDEEPENANAYLGKLLVEQKLESVDALRSMLPQVKDSKNYEKLIRFADDKLKTFLSAIETEEKTTEVAIQAQIVEEKQNVEEKKEPLSEVLAYALQYSTDSGMKDYLLRSIEKLDEKEQINLKELIDNGEENTLRTRIQNMLCDE